MTTTNTYDILNNIADLPLIGGSDKLLTFTCYESDGVNPLNIQTGSATWRLCPYGEPSINILEKEGVLVPQPPVSEGILSTIETYDGSPSDKKFQYDNATIASVTNILIDFTDYNGADQTTYLSNPPSDIIKVVDYSTPTVYQLWTITGASSSGGGVITYPVSFLGGSDIVPTGLCYIYMVDAGAQTYSYSFTINLSSSDTLALNGKYIQQVIITDFFGNTFIPGQGAVLILPSIASS